MGNEELQAATEEVETLNEELQATNEELETLNEELQATVEELNTTNDDLQTRNAEIQDLAIRPELGARTGVSAVLNSMGAAIVVVSRSGEILLSNSEYKRLFPEAAAVSSMMGAGGNPIAPEESPQVRASRGEAFRTRLLMQPEAGAPRAFEAVGQPLGGDSGGGVLVIREIQSRDFSNSDSPSVRLTGLYQGRHLFALLSNRIP